MGVTIILILPDLQKYVGIPYLYGGKALEGADCCGLACLFYCQEFGLDIDTSIGYAIRPTHDSISNVSMTEVIDRSPSFERSNDISDNCLLVGVGSRSAAIFIYSGEKILTTRPGRASYLTRLAAVLDFYDLWAYLPLGDCQKYGHS